MSTTTNLGITKLETNIGTQITRLNTALDTLDSGAGSVDVSIASGHVTLTATQYACGIIRATGAPAGARNVVLPNTGRWLCVNATTGGQTITFKTTAGTGIAVSASLTGGVWLRADGTNIVAVDSAGAVAVHSHTGTVSDGGALGLPLFTVQGSDPSSPTAGYFKVYVKNDGVYAKDSGGTVYDLQTSAQVAALIATAVTGLLDLKGSTDCSANPNYPSASKGDAYVVSVAGKIGGASGTSVDVGDVYFATADNGGGTQAGVGNNWTVLEHNLAGVLVSSDIGTTVQAYDADLTTWGGKAAPSGTVVGTSDTQTLTNKRVTPRTGTTTSSATPTINTDNVDYYSLTAQAADITSFTTNLSGTPTEGQTLWISIKGTGARAITWGASFESSTVTLPSTTISTDRLDVGFVWTGSKWRCVAVA